MVERYSFDEPLILVGGSVIHWSHLKSHAKAHSQQKIIAVDGGGNALREHGLMPSFLCGDFDSIENSRLDKLEREGVEIIALPDQNATDFQKTLARFGSPIVYAYGFLDGRMDHGLDALAQIAKNPARAIYLIGMEDIAFVLPSDHEIDLKSGTRISFWTPDCVKVSQSKGLKWPVDELEISAANMSISNQMKSDKLSVTYEGGSLIAIVPIGAIEF